MHITTRFAAPLGALLIASCAAVQGAADGALEQAGRFGGDRKPAVVIIDLRTGHLDDALSHAGNVIERRSREGGRIAIWLADAPNAGSMSQVPLSEEAGHGDFSSVADGRNGSEWGERATALADAAKHDLAVALERAQINPGAGADLVGAIRRAAMSMVGTGGEVVLISAGIQQSEQLDMLDNPRFDPNAAGPILTSGLESLNPSDDIEVALVGIATFNVATTVDFEDRVLQFWRIGCEALAELPRTSCSAGDIGI